MTKFFDMAVVVCNEFSRQLFCLIEFLQCHLATVVAAKTGCQSLLKVW